ncbi:Solute carrier organic anion transporter family member 1C1, partial [Orchesella cincta]
IHGQDNPAFDPEPKSTTGKKNEPDLVSALVHNPSISLPLYEISLNGKNKAISATDNSTLDANDESNRDHYLNGKTGKNSDAENGLDDEEDEDDNKDMRCGLGCFSPEWIQPYATKPVFMVVFTLLGVIQGMSWSYFTATITTLEKRFKISSQTAGIVMTGNEISQILFSVFISYFGGKGHRPRWISVGVLFSAISCFVLASPHLFYGSGEDALALTEEYGYLYDKGFYQDMTKDNLASSIMSPPFTSNKIGSARKGRVSVCKPGGNKQEGVCDADELISSIAPLIIIFLSQFVAGIGVLLFFTLGGPYLDDNSSRHDMPRVLGVTMSLRLIGPTIGYLIASGTLKLFVNPLLTPVITPDDPRWIGCWWLGWVIFGTAMFIMSFFIALFPKRLRRKNQKSVDPDKINSPEAIPAVTDIPLAVKSLLRNKVNLFNNLAGVFYLFSALGYWTYMPKYLETIFMQTASNASIISGVVGILFQSSGMLLSGILISKLQPGARKLAAWNVAVAFASVAVMVSFTQIGCNVGNVSFGTKSTDGTWNLTTQCNADCNCKTSKILPVCYKETNTVFYSACHAGCKVYENNTISDCQCITDNPNPTVKLGNCAEGCTGIFILFLSVSALIKFCDATGRIGNMLISYRCVELKDRSLSIGLNILMISLFAFLPSPILFGRIIDNVCLVWGGSTCGKRGNCMLYDGEQLRYIFNLTAAAFTMIGGLLDCLVWYYVKDMELYKEPEQDSADKPSSTPIKDKVIGISNVSYEKTESHEKR